LLRFTSPRFSSPRFTSLGFTSPRFTSPRFTSPRFTSPRFTSPRFTSPVQSSQRNTVCRMSVIFPTFLRLQDSKNGEKMKAVRKKKITGLRKQTREK